MVKSRRDFSAGCTDEWCWARPATGGGLCVGSCWLQQHLQGAAGAGSADRGQQRPLPRRHGAAAISRVGAGNCTGSSNAAAAGEGVRAPRTKAQRTPGAYRPKCVLSSRSRHACGTNVLLPHDWKASVAKVPRWQRHQCKAIWLTRGFCPSCAGVAAVPQGYDRAGHRDTGWELPQPYSVGASGHETLMFTAEGTMYRKP